MTANGAVTPLGATVSETATRFVVWAPKPHTIELVLPDRDIRLELERDAAGYASTEVDAVGHGDRYGYSLDAGPIRPDPASGWQPDGVHGPSAVVDPAGFVWTDDEWRGRGLTDAAIYELHVGTFTPGGTLDSAIAELPRLAQLGITTIELMPLAAFAGERNWGYDGVLPWSVHRAYGGPAALARFVDAAHAHGLAVILDVVFNHLGPEGNYLPQFGPYTTDVYRTPWGPAINVAGAQSDAVRRYFVECTRRWIRDFHLDGFRFDAVHAIVDPTARPFWAEICTAARTEAKRARRQVALIAESSDNDPRQLHPVDDGGLGFDAVWCDDVHHTLRVAVTGDRRSYYVDYDGSAAELADTVRHRWAFRDRYSIARGRTHGRPVDQIAPHRFVVCSQNHDQVGNRPAGDRPDDLINAAQRRFLAATALLLPSTPMLFQGEEYGERRPFPFFVDHTDPEILRATNDGRRAEFAGADWSVDVPEPGALATFESAILDPTVVERDQRCAGLLAMYTELLRLRRSHTALSSPMATQRVDVVDGVIVIRRSLDAESTAVFINATDEAHRFEPDGSIVFASDERWSGRDARAAAAVDEIGPWVVALTTTRP